MSSEELELRPGEQVALKLRSEPQSRYVGIIAAYRDLPHVQWRWVLALAPQQVTRAHLVLDQAGIRAGDPLASLEEN